jgi:hypothetical protein
MMAPLGCETHMRWLCLSLLFRHQPLPAIPFPFTQLVSCQYPSVPVPIPVYLLSLSMLSTRAMYVHVSVSTIPDL